MKIKYFWWQNPHSGLFCWQNQSTGSFSLCWGSFILSCLLSSALLSDLWPLVLSGYSLCYPHSLTSASLCGFSMGLEHVFKNSSSRKLLLYYHILEAVKLLCVHAQSLWSFLTLCDPMDCSPPGSSVHRILQARILEWVVMRSSKGSSQPRDWTWIFCTGRRTLSHRANWDASLLAWRPWRPPGSQ